MKKNISELMIYLNNKGVVAEFVTSEWSEPFVKITSCGLYDRNSVAETVRKNGFNVEIV